MVNMNLTRYLEEHIKEICFDSSKMAFVSGPRQCGKTTMAKDMLKLRKWGGYHNWDELKFRKQWTKDPSQVVLKPRDGKIPLIILDEIHKAKSWKRNLKGLFDTLEDHCDIIVTGSSRLNVYRKTGDSLMGRYYHFRLHPFSLAELNSSTCSLPDSLVDAIFNRDIKIKKTHEETLKLLEKFGPFPEPFLSSSPKKLNLWQSGRIEKIVREDLRDLTRLPELSQVEMLISLLPEKVGSLFSVQSLREDLEVAHTTVTRWLNYLKELYYFFEVKPYSKSLSNTLKKEGKIYLWDWSEVEEKSHRFENLVAGHLQKYCHAMTDTGEDRLTLRYVRNKQKKEIDFLILKKNKPWLPVEVKLNDYTLSTSWATFIKHLPCNRGIQVVRKPNIFKIEKIHDKEILIISANEFLAYLI
ncbi:MAG: ATP-binding protein [Candidatus Scalindua sp.]